jgi:hypothetical protein
MSNKSFAITLALAIALLIQTGCASGGNQAGGNAGNSSPAGGSQASSEPAIRMTAEELVEAYRMEPPDGAGKYKGKTIAVTGTVSRSGKDFRENLYVDLKGTNPMIEVHCIYTEEQRAAMSALRPGQQATIRGVCDGRFMSHVILKNSVPE